MRLTKENIKKMLPGQTLTVSCLNTPELNSAYETAKQAKREMVAEGFPYDIQLSCSGKTMEKPRQFDPAGHGRLTHLDKIRLTL